MLAHRAKGQERASAGQRGKRQNRKEQYAGERGDKREVRRDCTEDAQSRGRCERVYERTPTGADRGGAELPPMLPPMLPIRGGLGGTFLRKVLGAWRLGGKHKFLVVVDATDHFGDGKTVMHGSDDRTSRMSR